MHEKRANNFFSWNKLDHHARKVLHQGLNRAIQIWPHPPFESERGAKKEKHQSLQLLSDFHSPGVIKAQNSWFNRRQRQKN